jgi:effector-binding domain-containing protein
MPTLSEPRIVERPAQHFVGIELELTQPEIASKAPPLIQEIIDWLTMRGLRHSGPPFFNYTAFRTGGRMVMQVGMPISVAVAGDGKFIGGVLPGGRYVSLHHTGPYAELYEVNMALDDYARAQGLKLAGGEGGSGFTGATRLEIYDDPGNGPGGQPKTEVAFKLAD